MGIGVKTMFWSPLLTTFRSKDCTHFGKKIGWGAHAPSGPGSYAYALVPGL